MTTGAEQLDDAADVGLLRTYRSRWTFISLATLAYQLAGHLLRPLLTLRLAELGASVALIGVIVAVNPLITLLLALPSGRFIDRIGVGRIQRWSMLIMAVGGIGYVWATTIPALLALQVLAGIAELGTWLGLQSAITHAGTGTFRTRHLSLFALAWGSGLAFGPLFGGPVYERFGFGALGWIYSGLAAVGALCCLFAPSLGPVAGDPEDRPGLRGAVRRVLAQPAVRGVLIATFGCLAVGSLRGTYYPLFLEQRGLRLTSIGLLLSAYGIASLAVRAALPVVLRRVDPMRALIGGLAVATVAISATPLIVSSLPVLMVCAALAGAGAGLMPPITVELLTRHTPGGDRGVAVATRVMTNRAALFVQPLLFGAVASVAGLAVGFVGTGVLLTALTGWTAFEARRLSVSSRPEAAE